MTDQLQIEIAMIAQAISTFGMFGVIWMVQVERYGMNAPSSG